MTGDLSSFMNGSTGRWSALSILTAEPDKEDSMAAKPLPDQATLLKLLRYEPETGKLFWRERTPDMFFGAIQNREHTCASFNSSWAGEEAFTATMLNGYKIGAIGHRSLTAHRVIWTMITGDWPKADIDHINGDRADNKWCNLRSVSRRENLKNMAISKRNTSGHIGVYKDRRRGAFFAQIKVDGETINLGSFGSFDEAVIARKAAERKYGFHPNHGRKRKIA